MSNRIVTSSRMPWLAALALALVASQAAAQTEATQLEPAGAKENVWSRGVPEQERQGPAALLREANRLLRESTTVPAAGKYRGPLPPGDHPNIHYTLAL